MSAWIARVRAACCSRDARVFVVAAGLIAAHALADAVVAPEPGTSAGDHVVSVAATLGVLLAAVALYLWARAGARAAVAIGLGMLALEGFGIAAADANRPRGDDWTGFLLLPVGLTLCGLGVALLWRSRKPYGRRMLRRAALGLVALLGAVFVLVPSAVAILATHRPREAVTLGDLGRPVEQVAITTADALELHGAYVPSRNGAAVIVYPASSTREPVARMLVRHGYGVLMLQMRGSGASEGDPNMFGWGASRDLDAAASYLAHRTDVRSDKIGGIGFSVGGEQMIEAASDNVALRAVVSEGAGKRSLREALLRGPRGWLALPMEAAETGAVAALSGHDGVLALGGDSTRRRDPRAVAWAPRGAPQRRPRRRIRRTGMSSARPLLAGVEPEGNVQGPARRAGTAIPRGRHRRDRHRRRSANQVARARAGGDRPVVGRYGGPDRPVRRAEAARRRPAAQPDVRCAHRRERPR